MPKSWAEKRNHALQIALNREVGEATKPVHRKPSERAPKIKPGYEPGGIGWLLEEFEKYVRQNAICQTQAITKAKGTKEYRRYWMGFFKSKQSVETKRNEIFSAVSALIEESE